MSPKSFLYTKFEINMYMIEFCSFAICSPYIVAVDLDVQPKLGLMNFWNWILSKVHFCSEIYGISILHSKIKTQN